MSTQKNQSNRREAAEVADLKKFEAEKCIAIVRKFNDPLIPISIGDFKNLIFRCLWDTYINKRNSIVSKEDLQTMYFLWVILEEVEYLKNTWNLPHPED